MPYRSDYYDRDNYDPQDYDEADAWKDNQEVYALILSIGLLEEEDTNEARQAMELLTSIKERKQDEWHRAEAEWQASEDKRIEQAQQEVWSAHKQSGDEKDLPF